MEDSNSKEKSEPQDPWSSFPKGEEVTSDSGYSFTDRQLGSILSTEESDPESDPSSKNVLIIEQANTPTLIQKKANNAKSKIDKSTSINPQVISSSKHQLEYTKVSFNFRASPTFKKITNTKFFLKLIALILLVYILSSLYIIL